MIEVSNLTKTYGKGKNAVHALRGVSFTLPDKGLVFIVGKSGSGKSTLLNILGGLDDASSGQLYVNGEDITKLRPRELDNYRNYFVGIVYQHFNLFEDETVLKNIKIATDISNKKIDSNAIDVVIDRLDLTEKKNVLVRELSGGQKQRVAIARALAKYPHMILADEPTGNLDSKTSITIHNYLQRISREKLVVVISHDMKNANKYADRIIEISDGKIINDLVRDAENSSGNSISVSSEVPDEKIQEINEILKEKGISLTKNESGFKNNETRESYSGEKISFKGRNKSWKNALRLTKRFWNSSKASFFITAIISTFIIGLLSVAHGFAIYDGAKAVSTAVDRYDLKNFVLNKGYSVTNSINDINKDYAISLTENDINTFANEEKCGKSYPVYPITFYNGTDNLLYGRLQKEFKSIFITESFGTMVVNQDYINNVFNDPELLAGSYYGLEDGLGVLVTDYFADGLLASNKVVREDGLPIYSGDTNDMYAGLLGSRLSWDNKWHFQKINGVISTHYKETYKSLFDMYDYIQNEPQHAAELTNQMAGSDIFSRYLNDIKSRLGYVYTYNQNYLEDYVASDFNNCIGTKVLEMTNKYSGKKFTRSKESWATINETLGDDEILISKEFYNELYESSVGLDDEIELKMFDFNQNSTDFPVFHETFKVKGKVDYSNDNQVFQVSKNTYEKISKIVFKEYARCFDNPDKSVAISEAGVSRYFYTPVDTLNGVFQLINIIQIFSKIFLFIAIILMALVTMVVVSHNLRIIKKNQYRLGVYKSLGYSAAALGDSTLLNSLIMCVVVAGLSMLFMFGLSSIMNSLLVSSFIRFLGSDIFASLTLVEFSFPILMIYVGGVTVLTLLSTFIPVISIRKIKPNIIINKAE